MLVQFARDELARLVKPDDDGTQAEINSDIIAVVEKFAEAGHSGFSAGYAISILTRLLAFKPLGPLTGEDDEWVEVSDGVFQNKRRGTVFKDLTGPVVEIYDIEGKVFRDPDGSTWTGSDSRVPITFPYTVPDAPEVVDRPWQWPENVKLPNGRLLFMEGNITSDTHPFTVGVARIPQAKGEPAVWSKNFPTFYDASDYFDRKLRELSPPDDAPEPRGFAPGSRAGDDTARARAELDNEFPVVEERFTGGHRDDDPPFEAPGNGPGSVGNA